MPIAEAIPVISACQYYVGNDTGWGHISSGLEFKIFVLVHGLTSICLWSL